MRSHLSRRYGIAALAAIGAVTLSTPMAAIASPPDGASVDTVATVLDQSGHPTFVEVEAVTVAEERRKAAALAGVVDVSAEVPATVLATPNDPYRSMQWDNTKLATDNYTAVATVNQLVAVLDTGIRATHEDFATGQIRCDIGADFAGDGLSTNGCIDPNGHGTHVAGTVGAVANNGKGIAGTAPGVPILPVRVMNADGAGNSTSVAQGIVYAVDHGATVITMSLGGGYSSSYDTAVKYATDHNVVVIAAAGNNRTTGNAVMWPAASPGAESVAATDPNNVTASFSNSSGTADVAAPGVNILSTDTNGTYSYKSGTSMAAPHVAAAAALYRATHAGSTEAGTRSALESTATDIESPGRDAASGAGLINLAALLPATPTTPVTPAPVTPAPVTPAPSVPVKLVVTPAATAISLSWAASAKTAATPAATSYVVYRNDVKVATVTAASYVDKAITAATNYTYTVAAVAAGVTSVPSAAVPAYLTPAAPTTLATVQAAATVKLTWRAPVAKAAVAGAPTSYVVYRDGALLANVTIAAYTDTTVAAGTNPTYTVSAINPAGESALSNAALAYKAPAQPAGVTTTAAIGSIKVAWRAPAVNANASAATVYAVYRDGVQLATTADLSYTDSTAAANVTYRYTVAAANAAGAGPVSAVAPRLWTYPTGKLVATTGKLAPGGRLSVTGSYIRPGTTVTFTEAYKVTTTTMVNNKPVTRTAAATLVLGSAVADGAGNLTFAALPAQDGAAGTVTATAVDMNGKAISFTLAVTVK